MADVRPVTESFSVAPQLNVADVSALKAQGVTLLIVSFVCAVIGMIIGANS